MTVERTVYGFLRLMRLWNAVSSGRGPAYAKRMAKSYAVARLTAGWRNR